MFYMLFNEGFINFRHFESDVTSSHPLVTPSLTSPPCRHSHLLGRPQVKHWSSRGRRYPILGLADCNSGVALIIL